MTSDSAAGLFLPCCATEVDRVEATRPDFSKIIEEAAVAATTFVAPGILRLSLEPLRELTWEPGQVIGLMNPAEKDRSYSIASLPQVYLLEINIRVRNSGAVSGWAAGHAVGDTVRFQRPSGSFIWHEGLRDRPLRLIGAGCGGGALAGVARQALAQGHLGKIRLFHGARTADELYLRALHPVLADDRLDLHQNPSQQNVAGQPPARITELAFRDGADLSETAIFLCGNSNMVETARMAAMRAGASLDLIHAGPVLSDNISPTLEREKLASIQPDPELWAALDHGDRLTTILTEFYTLVCADARLAPFFHRTTKQRAFEKQFNFLQDLLHGTKLYLIRRQPVQRASRDVPFG